MQKNKQKTKECYFGPRVVMAVSMIILYGMLFGAVAYLLTQGPAYLAPARQNHPTDICSRKAEVTATCSKIGYEYDSSEKKCVAVNGAGCAGNLPFSSLVECQAVCENGIVESKEVKIKTDKAEYQEGEIIKIAVSNGLNRPILYSGSVERFWGIEYFKDDKWINSAYKEGGGFQLTEKNIGDTCNIVLYERTLPKELSLQSNLTVQWNQKICPFGTESPDKPKIVKYIESGRYRLSFSYGFEISSNDPFRLSEFQTVYSNEFTIKDSLSADTKCGQKMQGFGMCEAYFEGYEFDGTSCVKKGVSGCSFESPFDSLEVCQSACKSDDSDLSDYSTCTDDSDCISVKSDCCGCTAGGTATAINKKYRNAWLDNLGCREVMCPAVMSNDPSCIGKEPKCVNNQCELKKQGSEP